MTRGSILLLLAALMTAAGLDAGEKPKVPDFTQGGKAGESHDWLLGPTGARGWTWGWHCQTTDARQILITDVAKGSPADGVLQKDDVILGVDGKPFDDDARIRFARAITEAENEKNKGALRLVRWRAGRSENVELKLAVMGAYSATAPYECEKSKRIVEQGCAAIAKQGWKDKRGNVTVSIPNDLNALALLASGKEEYRPLVAEYAHKVAEHTPGGHISWGYGYETLFLAEYVLATKDEAARAGLQRLALDIARGQSGVGTWGHSFARPTDGILNGYGNMNQPGIILMLAMTVAREAGIKAPELDAAIDKGGRFLRWYVNKGAVPYGDHDPWPWHDDNGKCSSAAVLFDLLGDREAASFFAKMGTAAYNERESGHTGNFFNVLWALPGVARCGALATGAYVKETDWYYDLARGWDGRFAHQGLPGEGRENYSGWDVTGAYVLAYALPLKRLAVTGVKPCAAPPLSEKEVAEVIAAGRDFTFWTEKTCYDKRSTEELFAGLRSWSPPVRKRSAQALGRREGEFVPKLLEMLAGADQNTRYGACESLACLGPKADAAAPQARALLTDKDPWLKILAAESLVRMGPEVRKSVVPDLLRAAASQDPADRRKRVQGALAEALFTPSPGKREPKAILTGSLDGVDRPMLYAAVRELLKNEDGRIRGLVAPVYKLLTPEDAAKLMPDIVAAIQKPAPSGEMFADGIRLAGLDLLARLCIREGMAMCVELMEPERWGQSNRVPRCLEYLARYGANAKPFVAQLREQRQACIKKDRKQGEKNEQVVAIDKAIAKIEGDTKPPSLVDMKAFAAAPAGGK
jgi:hypothetical protein